MQNWSNEKVHMKWTVKTYQSTENRTKIAFEEYYTVPEKTELWKTSNLDTTNSAVV